jgi:hypothetical protein
MRLDDSGTSAREAGRPESDCVTTKKKIKHAHGGDQCLKEYTTTQTAAIAT